MLEEPTRSHTKGHINERYKLDLLFGAAYSICGANELAQPGE